MKSRATKDKRRDDRAKDASRKKNTSPKLIQSNESSPTTIMGGGRTAWSKEIEDMIVDLMMEIDKKTIIDTKADSEHRASSRRRHWLKVQLKQHYSSVASPILTSPPSGSISTGPPASAPDSSPALANLTGKVRVTLQDHDNQNNKKLLVLDRSTNLTSKEVLKSFKAKIKMKKKPVIAYTQKKKEGAKMYIDNLGTVEDGGVVFLSGEAPPKLAPSPPPPPIEATSSSSYTITPPLPPTSQIDPIESCKLSYKIRRERKHSRIIAHQKKSPLELTPNSLSSPPSQSQYLPDPLPPIPAPRSSLPSANFRSEILTKLTSSQILIISGETGCGKSTQVPQFLLNFPNSQILVTQPRRVAAIALADRVSHELKSPSPGRANSLVGFNVRLKTAVSASTRITYVTVGVLLRMLMDGSGGPRDYTHVVIDEVHERDMNTDFVLKLIRQLLRTNKTLKVVLMSATISSQTFLNYFEGFNPQLINIPGRTFPVTVRGLRECEQFANRKLSFEENNGRGGNFDHNKEEEEEEEESESTHKLSPIVTTKIDESFIVHLASKLVKQKDGAVLVFLPGRGEIESLLSLMKSDAILRDRKTTLLLPLYSSLPHNAQKLVFNPTPEGITKVVLATNVAETSVTIDDVVHVIDAGFVKESRYNPHTRIKELTTVWTSKASMKQRAGRAGRVRSGECWRLVEDDFAEKQLCDFTVPEIFRTPLDELILQCLLVAENANDEKVGVEVEVEVEMEAEAGVGEGFSVDVLAEMCELIEPPKKAAIVNACLGLREIGAIVGHGGSRFRLTGLGFHLSHLPMDARVGKVLISGAVLNCLTPCLVIAAVLSVTKPIFTGYLRGEGGSKKGKEILANIIESGFGGGRGYNDSSKGDLIAVVALYEKFESECKNLSISEQRKFCALNALDFSVLKDVKVLKNAFSEQLRDAGFVASSKSNDRNASLVSACLVAGLYPNVGILVRPLVTGKGRGGKLITKNGDLCRCAVASFQCQRLREASSSGKDAYVVYHSKSRSVSSAASVGQIFLNQVNFVSRFALLLFGGELKIEGNIIVVDKFLKFKMGEGGGDKSAILLKSLRGVLDEVINEKVAEYVDEDEDEDEDQNDEEEVHKMARREKNEKVIKVLALLLQLE